MDQVLGLSERSFPSWEVLISHYGDIASIVGLAITLIGFVVTLWRIRETRKVAEKANQIAREAIEQVSSRLFLGQVSDGVGLAADLRNACRMEQWEKSIDRCEQLRLLLASIVEDRNIKPDESDYISGAIDDLSLILHRLEEIAGEKKAPPLPPRMRTTLDNLTVYLGRLDGRLKSAVLEIKHG